MPSSWQSITSSTLNWLAFIFVILLSLAIVAIVVIYVIDRFQTKQAIRRNYPVVGRFRYLFEHLGEFFRQYFFAMDREELPFNRAQRAWVYRAAKNLSKTIAFGSTRDIKATGYVSFANCTFPTLENDIVSPRTITVGKDCKTPWTTNAFFGISGMSYGAISKPAVQALSYGAAKAGIWLNTGEGGLSPYHLQGGADIIFQIGTANYGVRDEQGNLDDSKLANIAKHEQVKLFELKLSQGAKPGKGGILPGDKVTEDIAEVRGIALGKDSISPNRHPDVRDNLSLIKKLNHIREITGKPVGFKFVLGSVKWFESFCQDIVQIGKEKAPDFITIDSCDGGTGAAPMTLMDDVGMSIRESLPAINQLLITYNLREHIKIFVAGKMINPADVAWALCSGADFCNSARGFMFSLGCIQSLQCNKNTCPTGITTHKKSLQRGLVAKEKSVRVANYAKNMMDAVGMIAHSCGVSDPRDLNATHARIVLENGKSIPLNEYYDEHIH
ncbi:FMN-binding glutamate synthase family protein [Thalassotalea ganghwensis]